MDVSRAELAMCWDGLVCDAEVPKEILYDVALRCGHDDRAAAVRVLTEALGAFAGPPKSGGLPFGAKMLRFRKDPYNLDVRVKADTVEVHALNRLKPKAVQRVVEAVGRVPGSRDLWIDASVPQFSKSYANIRACTPCQAAAMRR